MADPLDIDRWSEDDRYSPQLSLRCQQLRNNSLYKLSIECRPQCSCTLPKKKSEPELRDTGVNTHWNCFRRCGQEEMVATNSVWAIRYLKEEKVISVSHS